MTVQITRVSSPELFVGHGATLLEVTPAHGWVLPKAMWFGRAQYAPAARLEIS